MEEVLDVDEGILPHLGLNPLRVVKGETMPNGMICNNNNGIWLILDPRRPISTRKWSNLGSITLHAIHLLVSSLTIALIMHLIIAGWASLMQSGQVRTKWGYTGWEGILLPHINLGIHMVLQNFWWTHHINLTLVHVWCNNGCLDSTQTPQKH